MQNIIDLSLYPFLISFISVSLITPISIKYIKKFGLMDNPKKHIHPAIIHNKPIPRGGGLPIFLGALIAALFTLPINQTTISVFFAAFLALAIGLIDDKLNSQSKDVPPKFRLLINIVCAAIIVYSGISIKFITDPFTGGILHLDSIKIPLFFLPINLLLSDLASIIWLVWIMNILNWSKGIDGQMPGIVTISAIVIGILSLGFIPQETNPIALDARLSFIIAGSAAGFLIFNFYPAKIFPGYGATALYLLLGTASILSSAKLATAILVMGVPSVDAIFTIARRLYHKRSPFKGDKEHLHHLLLRLGLNQRQIALFYWAISVILGIISLNLQSRNKLFAIIMLVVITIGALLFLRLITRNDKSKTTS